MNELEYWYSKAIKENNLAEEKHKLETQLYIINNARVFKVGDKYCCATQEKYIQEYAE